MTATTLPTALECETIAVDCLCLRYADQLFTDSVILSLCEPTLKALEILYPEAANVEPDKVYQKVIARLNPANRF